MFRHMTCEPRYTSGPERPLDDEDARQGVLEEASHGPLPAETDADRAEGMIVGEGSDPHVGSQLEHRALVSRAGRVDDRRPQHLEDRSDATREVLLREGGVPEERLLA